MRLQAAKAAARKANANALAAEHAKDAAEAEVAALERMLGFLSLATLVVRRGAFWSRSSWHRAAGSCTRGRASMMARRHSRSSAGSTAQTTTHQDVSS